MLMLLLGGTKPQQKLTERSSLSVIGRANSQISNLCAYAFFLLLRVEFGLEGKTCWSSSSCGRSYLKVFVRSKRVSQRRKLSSSLLRFIDENWPGKASRFSPENILGVDSASAASAAFAALFFFCGFHLSASAGLDKKGKYWAHNKT
ncbi:hypothetical protein RIF29_46979 [Crotalaria pallida]|uniref:Uncharacterized protein n=1 Tax=Crotalaria pallida TaxID=3830 RepID=A0AAN9DXY1_CROPI